MSVQAITWVFEFSRSRLGARHVLLSIANHAKRDGTGAWPSVSTIARESRLSEREVRYALNKLVTMGELSIEVNGGPHGCNLYSLKRMQGQTLPGGKKEPQGGQNAAPETEYFALEPSLTVPKATVQNYDAQKRRVAPLSFRNVDNKTPQQRRYAQVGMLAGEAETLIGKDPKMDFASLKEAIKEIAARRGIEKYGPLSEKAAEIAAQRQKDALRQ